MAAYGAGNQTAFDPYARADSILQRHVERVKNRASGSAGEAKICWGKAGNFQLVKGSDALISTAQYPTVNWDFPNPDDTQGQDDEKPPELWNEIERTWGAAVRVYNPQDSGQYVDVEDVADITFERPDGTRVKFVFADVRN